MKAGRKNLKRAVVEDSFTLKEGQKLMQVTSLHGSNLIEVKDAQGEKSLASFPGKFQKSMWMKRGSFVVVDAVGREKALEAGSKVACMVSQVLYYEQVRKLQKSPEWPEIFRSAITDGSNCNLNGITSQQENESALGNNDENSDDEDDGLPPLEANMNRVKPPEMQADTESDSDEDS